jgi:hypothetical protein
LAGELLPPKSGKDVEITVEQESRVSGKQDIRKKVIRKTGIYD